MKRLLLPLLAGAALLAGCASGGPRVSLPGPSPVHIVPPSPTALRFSSAANREFARRDVQRLLRIVVLPTGAGQVARIPTGAPAWFRGEGRGVGHEPGVVSTRRIWIVGEPRAQVVRYVRAHARSRPRPEVPFRSGSARVGSFGSRPVGTYFFPPVPGRSSYRWLDLALTALRGGRTAVFAQAAEAWIRPSPRSAVLPRAVRRVDIVSRYGAERPNVLVHVHNRFDVASIVAMTNGLGVARAVVCALPVIPGPTVTLRFRAADGRALARAEIFDPLGSGRSGPCNPLRLTIGSRTAPPLDGGDFLLRIQELLGIELAPPVLSNVSSCLRERGWKVHSSRHALTATREGQRWTITFHATGKVTRTGPPRPGIARCLHPWPQLLGGFG
jgi:hypothetical protein